MCQLGIILQKKWRDNRATHPDLTLAFERVELAGFVVGLRRARGRILLSLDDGTGIVECTLWGSSVNPHQEAHHGMVNSLDVGDSISVRGQLLTRGNALELKVQWIGSLSNPEAECMHWMESVLAW